MPKQLQPKEYNSDSSKPLLVIWSIKLDINRSKKIKSGEEMRRHQEKPEYKQDDVSLEVKRRQPLYHHNDAAIRQQH